MSNPMSGFGPMSWSPFPYGPVPSSGIISPLYVDLFNPQVVAGYKQWMVAEQTGVAEQVAMFGVNGATGGFFIENGTSADGTYRSNIRGQGTGSATALNIIGQAVTDTGAVGVIQLIPRVGSSTPVTTRPLILVSNGGVNEVLSLLPLNAGANSALSWGTQTTAAPTVTTRSAGTRLVLRDALSASAVDYALGVGGGILWQSIAQNSSGFEFRWYGGTATIATLRGDGLQTNTGGHVEKVRTALTTPVTVVVGTDYIVRYKPTVDAAGSLVLPDPSTTPVGTRFDVKNRSVAFTLTVTATAGTVDGLASVPLAIRGSATFTCDGVSDYDMS